MNEQDLISIQKNNPHVFDAITFNKFSREAFILISFLTFIVFLGITFLLRGTHIQGQSTFFMTGSEILTTIFALVTIFQIAMWVMEGKPAPKKK